MEKQQAWPLEQAAQSSQLATQAEAESDLEVAHLQGHASSCKATPPESPKQRHQIGSKCSNT